MARPNILTDMTLTEVSLVDHPASPGAHVALFKRAIPFGELPVVADVRKRLKGVSDEGAVEAFDAAILKAATTFSALLQQDNAAAQAYAASADMQQMIYALADSVSSIFADPDVDDPQALASKSVDQFIAAIKQELSGDDDTDPAGEGAGDVDGGKPAAKLAAKPAAKPTKPVAKVFPPPCKCGAKAPDDAGQKDGPAHCAKCGNRFPVRKGVEPNQESEMSPEEVQKSITDAVTKAVSDAVAAKDAEIAKLRGDVTGLVEADATRVRLEKATKLADGVPGITADEVAGLLKGLDEAGVSALTKTLDAARQAHVVAKTFQPIGAQGGAGGSAGLEARIAKAVELAKAASPGITKEQALAKAFDSDRTLYRDYLTERRTPRAA